MERNEFKCTFVIIIDSNEGLFDLSKNFKAGILNKKSVQTIIVNRSEMLDNESESVKKFIKRRGYDYVETAPETSIPECYNSVFDKIKGEYVCFTNEYCIYDDLSLIALNKAKKSHPQANHITLNYKRKNPDLNFHVKRYNFEMQYVDVNDIENVAKLIAAFTVDLGKEGGPEW